MQRKVCGFDENDMKTYSSRRGLKENITESRDEITSKLTEWNSVMFGGDINKISKKSEII